MLDLAAIYRAFDAFEPLPADDNVRYVDLAPVRGSRIAHRLTRRIQMAGDKPSYHLVMGHTKCGKTTELNRAVGMLSEHKYFTVMFDVEEQLSGRTFEYTSVLLLMAAKVVAQFQEKGILVEENSAKKLAEFLIEKEVTVGGQLSFDATGKVDARVAPNLLVRLLGEFGLGLELRGGYQRSRQITTQIEADTRGFIEAVSELVQNACQQVLSLGYKGLVIVCDGCDKLNLNATDEHGHNRDLQISMFVDHAAELQSVPCHVIYTVPISVQANLGDIWEQSPEFVPAIPVTKFPDIDEKYSIEGRRKLTEVVDRRLGDTSIEELFQDVSLLKQLVDASGGHISDLLLLIRDAVLEAQVEEEAKLTQEHVQVAVRRRLYEYTRLLENKYLEILVVIDQYKTATANSDSYRELVFKRLVLEYICGDKTVVDLHPLIAATDAYQRWRRVDPNE
ncbi:hypothetical protein HC928_24775 [bacterium]|nr:hypothetical protein [bacterium]